MSFASYVSSPEHRKAANARVNASRRSRPFGVARVRELSS